MSFKVLNLTMRFINFNSIAIKIIFFLLTSSLVFISLTFTMTKQIFSQGYENIIYEKTLIIQNNIAQDISLNLLNLNLNTLNSIGNKVIENENILLLKISSKALKAPLIFTNISKKDIDNAQFTSNKKLFKPLSDEEIGNITLIYSTKTYDTYMQNFYTLVSWGIVAFLLSILLISWSLFKSLKPLSSLATSLDQFDPFNPQEFNQNHYKNDEIGSVAKSANGMIKNLINYINYSSELTSTLSTKESHLKDAQRIANVGSWEYNIVEDNLILSDEIYRILGIKSSTELTFKAFLDYITPDDQTRVKTIINNAIDKGSKFNIKYRITMNNAKIVHVKTRGKVRKKVNGSIKLTAVTINITKEIKNKQIIERLAYYDALTNLPNRSLLKDRINLTLAKVKRDNTQFAILFLDLDRFKLINDTLGHSIGDSLLVRTAKELKNILRSCDTISRIGGDEFVILLSDIKTDEDAKETARKILSTLNKEHTIDTHKIHISTSIGIALYPDNGLTLDELMTNADTAMYEAKKSGRNNFKIYSSTMTAHINKIIQIELDLRASLKNEEDFQVYYQAKINSQTNEISGAEALVRWKHPTKGLIFPDEFINIAEDSGLIIDIGNIIIHKVIKDIVTFNKLSAQKLNFAINLSPKQFQDKKLISNIASLLDQYNIEASQIEFEITESLSMQNIEETLKVLEQINNLGSSVAIDDFGTGYSSLSYLKQFPINTLKIDKSFVIDMIEDNDDKAIVKTIISMAQALDFKTVAEGVETKEHKVALSLMGCDELQGYHYTKAIIKEEFINLLKVYNAKSDIIKIKNN